MRAKYIELPSEKKRSKREKVHKAIIKNAVFLRVFVIL